MAELHIITVAVSADLDHFVLLTNHGQIEIGKASAVRLRNYLCQSLGTPTPEEELNPGGSVKDLALEIGGIYHNTATGEKLVVDPTRPGLGLVQTEDEP